MMRPEYQIVDQFYAVRLFKKFNLDIDPSATHANLQMKKTTILIDTRWLCRLIDAPICECGRRYRIHIQCVLT